jgi:hypothetical protein
MPNSRAFSKRFYYSTSGRFVRPVARAEEIRALHTAADKTTARESILHRVDSRVSDCSL